MKGTMSAGEAGTQMAGMQPGRSNQGGNQSRGGNYESPGGESAAMASAQMGANTTSGQPDNSELSRFMNNGGGPEPHQGANPGAQSDPGPKEIGFYDQAGDHMGGDDGVRAQAGGSSQPRMGGVDGALPNSGQRGGQNTGTSGAQTGAYSPEGEYGADVIPGVTGFRGTDAAGAQTVRSGGEGYGGIGDAGSAGNGQTGARSVPGGGAMGAEARNPVGFASSLGDMSPGNDQAGRMGPSAQVEQEVPSGQPTRSGYAGDAGASGASGSSGGSGGGEQRPQGYQSRAAQMLVEMREDCPTTYSRADGPDDDKPRVADKAGEVADAVKGKAGGFFSRAKDRMEGFLNVDLDSDGSVGKSQEMSPAPAKDARWDPEAFETRERKPHGSAPYEKAPYERAQPLDQPADGQYRKAGMHGEPGDVGREGDDSFTVFYGGGGRSADAPDAVEHGAMGSDGASRTAARQRELVGA